MIKEQRLIISTLLTTRMMKMMMMSSRPSKTKSEDKRRHRKSLRSNHSLIRDSRHLIHPRSRLLRSNRRTSRRKKNPTKNLAKMDHLSLQNLQSTLNLLLRCQNNRQHRVTPTKVNRQSQRTESSQHLKLQKRRMLIRKRM